MNAKLLSRIFRFLSKRSGPQMVVSGGLVFLALALAVAPVQALPAGYQEYYVLGKEDQIWKMYDHIRSVEQPTGTINSDMDSVVTLVSTADSQVVYYDHWEDGYESDLQNPVQSTTEVYHLGKGEVLSLKSNQAPPVHTYDFSSGAGADKWAWGNSLSAAPPPTTSITPSIALTATSYTNIATSDGTRYSTGTPAAGNYAAMRFSFTLTETVSQIEQLTLTFRGRGDNNSTVYLWVWNNSTSAYEFLQSGSSNNDFNLIGYLRTNIANYLDGGGRLVFLAADTTAAQRVRCDYVSVGVTTSDKSSAVPANPRGTWLRYDGGDRLLVTGGPVSLVHAVWPHDQSIIGDAWAIYSLQAYEGTYSYRVPVGVDLPSPSRPDGNGAYFNDFKYVWLQLQALYDNTTVSINNGAGSTVNINLDRGQTYSSQGYIDASSAPTITVNVGTSIISSKELEAGLVTGSAGAYRSDFINLQPILVMGNEYVFPAPRTTSGSPAEVFVNNPNDHAISITAYDSGGNQTFTVPANVISSTLAFNQAAAMGRYVPISSSVRLVSADPFAVVVNADSGGITYDWSFSPIPAKYLSDDYYLSWAPGSDGEPPTANGSPVWVAPLNDNTTFYVDYGPVDGTVDQTFTLNTLQLRRVFAPGNDNTGMHVWATGKFSMVWGEDPATAGSGTPYLDMGTTVLPLYQGWLDPILQLNNTVAPSILPPTGGAVTFTLTANAYNAPVSGVLITNTLPISWTYVTNSAQVMYPDGHTGALEPVINGQALAWNPGTDLAMNQALTITFQAQTTGAAALNVNHGEASGTYRGNIFRATGDATVYLSFLNLQKSVDHTTAGLGSTLVYTLTYINSSSTVTATNVVLNDSVPQGTTYQSGGAYNAASGVVSWTAPSLAPGASGAVTYSVAINNSVDDGAVIENIGYIRSDQTVNAGSNIVQTTALAPDVSLTKSGPATAVKGDTITYTLAYANAGGVAATGVVISDSIPVSTTYVANSLAINTGSGWTALTDAAGYTVSPPAVVITPGVTAGQLAAGETGQIHFSVRISSTAPTGTAIQNSAVLARNGANALSSNLLTTHLADLLISSAAQPSAAGPGGPLTFTLTYGNASLAVTGTNVTARQSIPANTAYISGTATGGDSIQYSWNSGITWSATTPITPVTDIRWVDATVPTNTLGLQLGFAVRLADPLPGAVTIHSSAYVTSTQVTSPQWSNEVVIPTVNLSLAESAATSGCVNSPITYTMTYGNNGTADANGVVITASVPSGTTLVPGSISGGGTESGGIITWVVNTPAGSSGLSFGFRVAINSGLANGFAITNQSGLTSAVQSLTVSSPPGITVINNVPVASVGTASTSENQPVTINILAFASDPESVPLSVTGVTAPLHGAATISGTTVIYTPTLGFSGTDVFTYTVSDGVYASSAGITMTVTDAPITGLTAANSSPTVYGQTTVFTATVTGGTNVSYFWNFGDGYFSVSANANHQYAAVGNYTAIVTATNNVSSTSQTTAVSVTRAPLTATADDKSKTYGAANPALTVSYGGFVNGDTASVLSGQPISATSATTGSAVGTYPITVTQGTLTATNYAFTFVNGTLTVIEVPITGLAASSSSPLVYGNPTTFTATITGGTNVSYQWNFGDGSSLGSGATTTHQYNVGTYTAIVTATNSLSSTTQTTAVIINRAALTVTADNKSKMYGAANPALTVSYGGFVNGDTASVLSGQPISATSATTGSAVGTYPITVTQGTLTATNYAFTFVNGTLTVIEVPITGLAASSSSPLVYGNPTTFTATITGGTNVSYQWNFGDGSSLGSGATTTHQYNVGTYTAIVTATNSLSSTTQTTAVVISRAALTVTADNKSKMYGAANPALTVSYGGFVNGDTASVLSGQPISATSATTGSPVGTYPITVTQGTLTATNYAFTFVNGTLTVNNDDAPITGLAAQSSSPVVYGQTMAFTATIDTGTNVSYYWDFGDGYFSVSANANHQYTAVGNYMAIITATNGAGSVTQTTAVVISRAALTVTADNKSKMYGAANPALTVSYGGFVNGDTASVLSGQPISATSATTGSAVGTYPITVTQGTLTATNYAFTFVNGTLTVSRAALTATADDKSKTYGAANPALTVSYGGFVNGDTASVLSGQPISATSATMGSPVGTYPITVTQGTLTATNYALTFVNGTLTVSRAALTATADDKNKTYGAANPALTVSYGGFVNGDTASVLSGQPISATSATTGSAVGTYPITVTQGTLTATNYAFTFVNGTLTVIEVPITGLAASSSSPLVYGNPTTFTATITGGTNVSYQWNFGDGSSLGSGATTTHQYNVGTYTAIVTATNSLSSTTQTTAVVISRAALTVTADNKSKMYGAANPALTVSYGGFVNGDTASVLSGQPISATSATTGSPVGTYPITVTQGTLTATNYAFTFVNGTLTISRATLTVTANNTSRTYGAANPAFTASYSGFVGSDNASVLSGSPLSGTTATVSSPVATYPITVTQGTLTATNYAFTFVNGTLSVNRAALTVSADNKVMPVGGPLPALTVSYTGFVNGENTGVLSGQPVSATSATAGSPVGTYPITVTQGTLTATNYAFTFVNGVLTVTNNVATITLGNLNQVYDGLPKPVTATTTPSGLTVNFTYDGSATPPTAAGAYAVSAVVSDTTYTGLASGTLVVARATLTVTADNKGKVYSDSLPALTVSYSGFVPGDNAGVLSGQPVSGTSATAGSAAGTYPITVTQGTLTATNYAFTFVNGTLTVNALPVDIGVSQSSTPPSPTGNGTVVVGTVVRYTVIVSNLGARTVSGVTVTDAFPSTLTGVTWMCTASGVGSSCSASGTGNLNETVTVAGGGYVRYVVQGTASTVGSLSNTATAAIPSDSNMVDPVSNNNSAVNTLNVQSAAPTGFYVYLPLVRR